MHRTTALLAALSVGCLVAPSGSDDPDFDGLGLQEYAPVDTGEAFEDDELDGAVDTCPQPDGRVSVAEAWDRGWAEVWYDGWLNIHNAGPHAISMDAWNVWFTETSQDAAAGSADYAYGTDQAGLQGLEIPPGETWGMVYTAEEGPAWWCIERTQVTQSTTSFHYNGAEVPDVLMKWIFYDTDEDGNGVEDHEDYNDPETGAPQAQTNVWDTIADGPVMVVGRVPNYVELSPGESTNLTIEVVNLGRSAGSMVVSETLPAGAAASDFSVEPSTVQENSDGTTTYTWANKMPQSVDDPDISQPTEYGVSEITYTLTWLGPECGERVVGDAPRVDWSDIDSRAQVSWGTELVIACCPG